VSTTAGVQEPIRSTIPARLDRLGWSKFHTCMGLIASVYLVGQIIGALVFGRLSDQLGRRRLLMVTLLLYLPGTGAAAFNRP
jgi:MFS family permease